MRFGGFVGYDIGSMSGFRVNSGLYELSFFVGVSDGL